jgi:antitoxin ParD1/3/4
MADTVQNTSPTRHPCHRLAQTPLHQCYDLFIHIGDSEVLTMATIRKTITLTDTQDGWIKAQIKTGGFTNDSEYIRDLIRREQERSAEVEAIRAALLEGEASGEPRPFNSEAFKRRMRATHG